MDIGVDDVKYIAKLAKLRFTEEQAKKLAEEFKSILTHFQTIDKLDLSDINLNIYNKDLKSVLRKDEMVVFEDKTKLFQNVKSMMEGSIMVPKIIE